jgi:hypothetical protein
MTTVTGTSCIRHLLPGTVFPQVAKIKKILKRQVGTPFAQVGRYLYPSVAILLPFRDVM